MLEIKGRVTTAICYAKVIEDEAIEQIRRMCDYDLTRGSKVRIMPDVHAGKGYGTIRSDEEEVHKRDVREAELYMTFITRYADVIEVIKKYDYPGNAADEVAAVLGITRDEVGFIYDMFDPVLFSASRIQTIKTMLEDTL